MSLVYKLSIDIARPDYLAGWCFHRWHRSRPVELQLWCSGRVIGETTADRMREDLAALGVHPTGRCGFELALDGDRGGNGGADWQLREKRTGKVLALIDGASFSASRRGGLADVWNSVAASCRPKVPNILFLHIPKTAGTSFNTLVRTLLSPEQVISHIEAMAESSYPQLARKYRFISGHLRFGVFKEHFLRDGAEIFTIVREPYGHLHSHLKWMAVRAEDQPDNSPKFRNQVIYRIGRRVGETDFTDPDDIARFVRDIQATGAPFFDNMQTRHFLGGYVDRVTEVHLHEALGNSASFTHIGFTEEYPAFISRFAEINRLKKPVAVPALNRSASAPLFDLRNPSIREQLLPLIRHDLVLHDHLRGAFNPFRSPQHTIYADNDASP